MNIAIKIHGMFVHETSASPFEDLWADYASNFFRCHYVTVIPYAAGINLLRIDHSIIVTALSSSQQQLLLVYRPVVQHGRAAVQNQAKVIYWKSHS